MGVVVIAVTACKEEWHPACPAPPLLLSSFIIYHCCDTVTIIIAHITKGSPSVKKASSINYYGNNTHV
jgi:hypothetical protein